MNWQTFGHKQVKGILERQLQNGVFPHTYLFEGPSGVGKKNLALELAASILETSNPLTHPDFTIVDTEGEIKIAQIRELIPKLAVKPFVSKYKVSVINNADQLNTESSNALLKTLEEPSPSTIIILVSKNKQLPKTLLSRCQILHFNILSEGEMVVFAEEKSLGASPELIKLSAGLPGKLVAIAEDPKKAAAESARLERFEAIRKQHVAQRILAVKEFAEMETDELKELFMEWIALERVRIRSDLAAHKSLGALVSAIGDLDTNKNKQLILQSLFLKI